MHHWKIGNYSTGSCTLHTSYLNIVTHPSKYPQTYGNTHGKYHHQTARVGQNQGSCFRVVNNNEINNNENKTSSFSDLN